MQISKEAVLTEPASAETGKTDLFKANKAFPAGHTNPLMHTQPYPAMRLRGPSADFHGTGGHFRQPWLSP